MRRTKRTVAGVTNRASGVDCIIEVRRRVSQIEPWHLARLLIRLLRCEVNLPGEEVELVDDVGQDSQRGSYSTTFEVSIPGRPKG